MHRLITIATFGVLAATTASADWTGTIVRRATQEAAKSAVGEAGKLASKSDSLLSDIENEKRKLPYTDGMTRYIDLIVEGESVYSVEHMDFDAEDTKAVLEMARKSMGKPGLALKDEAVKRFTEIIAFDKTSGEAMRARICVAIGGAPDSIIRRALESGMNYVEIVTSGVDSRIIGVREYNPENCKF